MINTLIVKFKNSLSYREVPSFRGAVIRTIGSDCNELYHNHQGEGFRYRYPMIQYKRIGGKAAIVCVGEGCDEIGTFFNNSNFCLRIGNDREEEFEIASIVPHRTLVQVWNESFPYYIHDWLPLNSENYKVYQQTEGLVERTQMLERIMVGNILSACKGLGVQIKQEITCQITQLGIPHKVYYKGVPWMGFGGEMKCNVSLPDYIGLGKGASMGHGVVVRKYEQCKI